MTQSPTLRAAMDALAVLVALAILGLLFLPGLHRAQIARNELDVAGQLETMAAGNVPMPEGIVEWGGFLLRVDPGRDGSSWVAYAWPRIHGETGIRAFSVRAGGPVQVAENKNGAFEGSQTPPPQRTFPNNQAGPWRPLRRQQNSGSSP